MVTLNDSEIKNKTQKKKTQSHTDCEVTNTFLLFSEAKRSSFQPICNKSKASSYKCDMAFYITYFIYSHSILFFVLFWNQFSSPFIVNVSKYSGRTMCIYMCVSICIVFLRVWASASIVVFRKIYVRTLFAIFKRNNNKNEKSWAEQRILWIYFQVDVCLRI